MNDRFPASLIVTTYNWPGALKVMLQSVIGQSVRPMEVIVADDGSGPETAVTIERTLRPSGLRWCHVWQEDKGVRQSRIKNLAARLCRGSYLIWVDQDVVLHRAFVSDHLFMARDGRFLQGKRSLLPKHFTEEIVTNGRFRPPRPWIRGLGNRKNTFRFPVLGRYLSRARKFEGSLRGCNLSMFKKDFLKVDGFDEVFDQSWGREDSDICYRLFHSGLRVKTLWFSALQYHLYHEIVRHWDKERLDAELRRCLQEKRVKALKGFSRLSSEGEVIAASDGYYSACHASFLL